MFCSTCGKSLSGNLNYCNNCGTRIEKNPLVVSNASSRLFAAAAGVIGVIGLIGLIPLLDVLLKSRLDPPAIIILAIAYLATLLLLFFVLVGHVWKNSGDIRIKGSQRAEEYEAPPVFRGINTAQLEEPREPVMSVTDHTTKILDKVPYSEG